MADKNSLTRDTVKRNLFFIAGSMPTEDEQAQYDALGGASFAWYFRNAAVPVDFVENHVELAGLVPAEYGGKPTVKATKGGLAPGVEKDEPRVAEPPVRRVVGR